MVSANRKLIIALWATMIACPALAQTSFVFTAPGADPALTEVLRKSSQSRSVIAEKNADAQDVFAAARADYARLLGALYEAGHYGGSVSVRLDGREAAAIAPMDAPDRIDAVDIRVEPGPVFHFSKAAIAPIAAGTLVPEGFAVPKVAGSGQIVAAATGAVSAWRDVGRAKARVADESVVVDHRTSTLAADIRLDPGPVVVFGTLHMTGNEHLRSDRLEKIAGFPSGKKFSPEALEAVRDRLRRTGIFGSVTLSEAETLRQGNLLDADLVVVEAPLRRLGFGAEISTADGGMLSGYWLHRNLRGGGERLRIDAEVSGIGVGSGGADYALKGRLDRPATLTPDTSAYLEGALSRKNEDDYDQRGFTLGFGLAHVFSPRLSGEAGIGYDWSRIDDSAGRTIYRQVTLPTSLLWDNRNQGTDATRGYYGKLELMPFYALSTQDVGLRLAGDLRAYRGFGERDRFVLAGRTQFGGVFGPTLADTPRDYLFYSGGGGTVRGQPYQALGVTDPDLGGLRTGGNRFIALSTELRLGVTESIGAVAFFDAARVGNGAFFGDRSDWHSGAGLGMRYKTPIGPIRLDVAAPLHGPDDGVQLYLGIGQAF